jgi:hypothetical protein
MVSLTKAQGMTLALPRCAPRQPVPLSAVLSSLMFLSDLPNMLEALGFIPSLAK